MDIMIPSGDVTMNLLKQTDHRSWSLPKRPWLMTQTWHDVLFAHWIVPADQMSIHLPEGLTLDLFEGEAWIGVVPFGMRNVRLRGIVGFPTATTFPELNVRTYVIKDGIPGVWFFSLDAASAIAVAVARAFFHLPYYKARMRLDRDDQWIGFDSRRVDSRGETAVFRARYRSTGDVSDGELDRWLTERYCLYASNGKHLFRGEIHHLPWRLERTEAVIEENTMDFPLGIQLREMDPIFHFSKQMDVIVWPLSRV